MDTRPASLIRYTLPDGTRLSLYADDRGARVGDGATTYAWWQVAGRMTRRAAEALAAAYVTDTLRGVVCS